MTIDTLHAFINGVRVGELRREPGGALSFTYATSWLTDVRATPVSLSLPLGQAPHRGPSVQHYFDGLLPDRDDVRALLRRTLGAKSDRTFDLLAVVGRDCVGAIELSADPQPVVAGGVTGERIGQRLTEREVGDRLRQLGEFPLGLTEDDVFRLSLAGAQSKTALLFHDGRWWAPAAPTPTTHILKPPMGVLQLARGNVSMHDSVENEWLSLRLMSALGVPTAKAQVLTLDGQRVLAVERFDRQLRPSASGLSFRRFPQEDFAQALGVSPRDKYENEGGPGIVDCMELLARVSTDPEADRRVFFVAQLAGFLLAAPDGHAKNYSVFLLPGGRARLTPLYDVMSAYPMMARGELPEQKVELAMSFRGKRKHYRFRDVRADHIRNTAALARVPEAQLQRWTTELLARVPGALREARAALPKGFPKAVSQPIFAGVTNAAQRLVGAG